MINFSQCFQIVVENGEFGKIEKFLLLKKYLIGSAVNITAGYIVLLKKIMIL